MRIWLDDIREPPDDSWQWVKNWDELKPLLDEGAEIEVMSFDHDLGLDTPDGYDIIKKIGGHYAGLYPQLVLVHSMNPVGRENILNYDRFFRAQIGLRTVGEKDNDYANG